MTLPCDWPVCAVCKRRLLRRETALMFGGKGSGHWCVAAVSHWEGTKQEAGMQGRPSGSQGRRMVSGPGPEGTRAHSEQRSKRLASRSKQIKAKAQRAARTGLQTPDPEQTAESWLRWFGTSPAGVEVPGAGKVLFSPFSTGLTDPIGLDCELRKCGLSGVTIFGSFLKRRTGSNGVGQRVLMAGFGECLWRCASVSTGVTVFVDPADLDSLRDKVSRRPSPKTAELDLLPKNYSNVQNFIEQPRHGGWKSNAAALNRQNKSVKRSQTL